MNDAGTPRTVLNETKSGSPIFPSLQFWDYIKRGLDRQGTPMASYWSSTLRENLDTLVPSYQTARAAAQPTKFFNGAPDAFEAGRNYIDKGIQFGPDAQRHLANMTTEERALFQDGYASALVEKLQKTPHRRNVLNSINNSDAARNEIETALGPQRYRELEARLRLEGIMDSARGAVQGNSTTARQLAELGLAGAGSMTLGGGNPPSGDPAAIVNAALMWGAIRGIKAGGAVVDERVSKQVAKLLTSDNPQHIRLGMNMLGRNPNLMRALRRPDLLLARAAAPQAQQVVQ